MKRIICFMLVLAFCLPMCACGSSRKAYELSGEAFSDIQAAVEKIDQIGSDILSAWNLGIYSESKLKRHGEGFALFCDNVSLSRDDCLAGLAYFAYIIRNDIYASGLSYYQESVYEYYDLYFYSSYDPAHSLIGSYDNIFSACVNLVVTSYEINGTTSEIQSLLSSAGEKVKQLSESYSDYEHYQAIKEYYTAANTYFNFCSEPTGSLETARNNVNDYRNAATNCYNSLYYFFES